MGRRITSKKTVTVSEDDRQRNNRIRARMMDLKRAGYTWEDASHMAQMMADELVESIPTPAFVEVREKAIKERKAAAEAVKQEIAPTVPEEAWQEWPTEPPGEKLPEPELVKVAEVERPIRNRRTSEQILAERGGVEIPKDWKNLIFPKLMSLAGKLSDERVRSRVDCEAAIEAELARRAKGE